MSAISRPWLRRRADGLRGRCRRRSREGRPDPLRASPAARRPSRPQASRIAFTIAGAVDTIAISPMPTEPSVPSSRGVSTRIVSMSMAWRMLGNLNVTQSFVLPATYSSRSANPTPMSMPPWSWPSTLAGWMIRPGSAADVIRRTRTSPVSTLTSTSAIWTENTWTSNDGPEAGLRVQRRRLDRGPLARVADGDAGRLERRVGAGTEPRPSPRAAAAPRPPRPRRACRWRGCPRPDRTRRCPRCCGCAGGPCPAAGRAPTPRAG